MTSFMNQLVVETKVKTIWFLLAEKVRIQRYVIQVGLRM